jgi:hypothetical protein
MKMKKRILFVTVFVIFSLLLSSCSKKDPLLGKWQEPVSGITLVFNDDGTLVIGRGGAEFTVNYEKQEPNIIAITATETTEIPVKSVTYTLNEDLLTITLDNVNTVFIRVKK